MLSDLEAVLERELAWWMPQVKALFQTCREPIWHHAIKSARPAQVHAEQHTDHIGLTGQILREQFERRFPTILERCHSNLNPLEQPIPVAPAAHYWMGGVARLKAATSLLVSTPSAKWPAPVCMVPIDWPAPLMECLVFARQLGEIDLPASETDRSH